MPLLRSYRANEWERWFAGQGLSAPQLRGQAFDSSLAIAEMTARSHGVGLVPVALFSSWIRAGRLVRPFETEFAAGDYWLTRLHASPETTGQGAFRDWFMASCEDVA